MIKACVIGLGKRSYNLISKSLLQNKDLNIIAVCNVYNKPCQTLPAVRGCAGRDWMFANSKEKNYGYQ